MRLQGLLALGIACSCPAFSQPAQNPTAVEGVLSADGSMTFDLGGKRIVLYDFKVSKPWSGDWTVSYAIGNRTDHRLEDVVFQFFFCAKDGKVLASPDGSVPSTTVFSMDDTTIPTPKIVSLYSTQKPKNSYGIKVVLSNCRILENESERIARKSAEAAPPAQAETEADPKFNALMQEQKEREARDAEEQKVTAEAQEKAAKDAARSAAMTKKEQAAAKAKREAQLSRYSAEDQAAIRKHRIHIGMDKQAVILSWGRPEDINSSTSALRTREQWVYGLKTYVYFEGGEVTFIQN